MPLRPDPPGGAPDGSDSPADADGGPADPTGVLGQVPGLSTGEAALGQLRLDPSPASVNPGTLATAATAGSAVLAIREIVERQDPDGAELVAQALARRYGRFDAANTPANRAAVLDALIWLADTHRGLAYDAPRARQSTPLTQSPNETLARRAGVCRDIHTATAAILASLMNARSLPDGTWAAGSPNGRESDVQSIGYDNPAEYHNFMVWKDPATLRWCALEYDKRYDLQAATALDAMEQTVGSLTGFLRYTLNGWNGRPIVDDLGAVGAARSNAFLSQDPGTGAPGEVRATVEESDLQLTGFVTRRLSFSAAVDPSALANGLRGGIQVNYHRDFETVDAQGYLRVAGGVTSDFAESSLHTGARDASTRGRFQTWVLGLKVDARLEGRERSLLQDHLKAQWGFDLDGLAGLPIASGGGLTTLPVGAITDYSRFDLGARAGLSGHERLSDALTLDWLVRGRLELNALAAATGLATGPSGTRNLLLSPPRAEVALALTHRAQSGLVTRFEAGATVLAFDPYDPQTAAREVHHAALTVSPGSGVVNFGLLATGETLDHRFVPVDGLGVAVSFDLGGQLSAGVGASTVFQGGNPRQLAEGVQVTGSLSAHF